MSIARLREKLTYANVVSTLCLFLILCGGTFAVAAALKKNSVKAKQIAPNSVGRSEIKPGAVTGSEVNEATLGEVPSAANATNAQNATNAENATNAQNADTLGGNRVVEINYNVPESTGQQTILTLGGLEFAATCPAGANTNLIAGTTKAGSSVYVSGIDSDDANDTTPGREIDSGDFEDATFDPGDILDLGANIGAGGLDSEHGFLAYFAPDGSTVTAYFALDKTLIGPKSCHVNGFAIAG